MDANEYALKVTPAAKSLGVLREIRRVHGGAASAAVVSGQWSVVEKEVTMAVESYKDLKVWQKAIDLVPEVYRLLRKLPRTEQYAMADQIRRAVVSVPANIAEGQARQHRKEFIQSLLHRTGEPGGGGDAADRSGAAGVPDSGGKGRCDRRSSEIRRMLQGLINGLRAREGG